MALFPLKDQDVQAQSVGVDGDVTRRNARHPEGLVGQATYSDVSTLYESFLKTVRERPNAKCLGSRVRLANGQYGAFEFCTYKQTCERAENFGAGLMALSDGGMARAMHIGIFSGNREEWMLTDLACLLYDLVTVPLYDTLGPDSVSYIVSHASLEVVVTQADKLSKILSVASSCPSLKHVVCMDGEAMADELLAKAQEVNICVHDFNDLCTKGEAQPLEHRPALTPDSLVTIMYTSGTTGTPKGVMLTHKCFVATVSAVLRHFDVLQPCAEDSYLSYLPLAHSLERAVLHTLLGFGARIGFFQGDITKIVEDIQEMKPTVFIGVPRIYNRIYDGFIKGVNQAGGLKKWLFWRAFAAREAAVRQGKDTPVWNWLVLNKLREKMGGNVRLMISGSAPLDEKVQHFIKIVLGAALVEGYGLTETTGPASVSLVGSTRLRCVGPPFVCCEYKLVDVPEMEYLTTDKPNPRGEVLIRGLSVFTGYYKDEEKTKEVVDEDGWFHTGDIGHWNPDGSLSIIDRKKNIFKLSQGEYVSAEYLEGVYAESLYVSQIFVYGHSMKRFLLGIVHPDADTLRRLAAKRNILDDDLDRLCMEETLKAAVLEDLTDLARAHKLKGFEYLKDIHLTPVPFSVDNNTMTPTFKLRRPQCAKMYEKQLADMYRIHDPDVV
eukprot:TRINITY_DN11333_c0_g1_i1.p1 TRINITY_DN11333_c0_g1~~TRINITY_DN11333_c0_g1_i1.p1  ORF type:complete len:664 (+),score=127.87 TRINITY_DN11333_c0_g1_i1:3-1994(+)